MQCVHNVAVQKEVHISSRRELLGSLADSEVSKSRTEDFDRVVYSEQETCVLGDTISRSTCRNTQLE